MTGKRIILQVWILLGVTALIFAPAWQFFRKPRSTYWGYDLEAKYDFFVFLDKAQKLKFYALDLGFYFTILFYNIAIYILLKPYGRAARFIAFSFLLFNAWQILDYFLTYNKSNIWFTGVYPVITLSTLGFFSYLVRASKAEDRELLNKKL